MSEFLTAAQMRAAEQAAIGSGRRTGLELMECAGQGAVTSLLQWRPSLALAPHRATIVCGPGNNGGDGFVVARVLAGRGWDVEVRFYGDLTKLPPDAAEMCVQWRRIGALGRISDWTTEGPQGPPDVFVDALFGTGLTRSMPADIVATLLSRVSDLASSAVRLAIDLPSGLCADSGRVLGQCVPADLTVTFHRPKLGHVLADGPGSCGTLRVVPIGLDEVAAEGGTQVRAAMSGPRKMAAVVQLSKGTGRDDRHKYAHGHALVLSGGVGHGGAARLAARAALRIGAGLVTVGVPAAALIENAAQLNAVMVRRLDSAEALDQLLQDDRITSVCLGPGMGVTDRTRGMVLSVLASSRPCILDADALTVFADRPTDLFEALNGRAVLTPHGGEFRSIFPDIAEKMSASVTTGPAYSKVDGVRDAARRAGCIVLLKGADTTVADAQGQCVVNPAQYMQAVPWLATAGSGDVLAGLIAGLLSRGFDPLAAAEVAAWLHADCARRFGPGLIAEDLPEQIPAVLASLGVS